MSGHMRLLSEGSEAKIYCHRILGKSVLFKVRNPKDYRVIELDEKIRKYRTRREAKIMLKAGVSGIRAPKLLAAGKFTICMDLLPGKLMKDVRARPAVIAWVGRLLAELHNVDIVHGDFTPANVMICNGKPFAIDFGLSEITVSYEEKAMDLLLMKRSLNVSQFKHFISGYKKKCSGSSLAIAKLKEIEKRGRYKIRTLATG